MRKRYAPPLAGVLVLVVLLSGFSCSTSTRKLATASNAIAHAMANAQTASKQAAAKGIISAADEQQFENVLAQAASAGLILNTAIRNGESAQNVAEKTKVFLDAFNTLNTSGVAGIKNPDLQLTISTILTGAETSIAVIQATVGVK